MLELEGHREELHEDYATQRSGYELTIQAFRECIPVSLPKAQEWLFPGHPFARKDPAARSHPPSSKMLPPVPPATKSLTLTAEEKAQMERNAVPHHSMQDAIAIHPLQSKVASLPEPVQVMALAQMDQAIQMMFDTFYQKLHECGCGCCSARDAAYVYCHRCCCCNEPSLTPSPAPW